MTVAILVPLLRRPHRVEPLIESIEAATPEPHRILFLCTPTDGAVIDTVDAYGGERLLVDYLPGDYARKINTGFHATTEPFVFCAADDLKFHDGWLPAALAKMTEGIGVVGTNDLGNSRVKEGRHSTHSLVARAYVDEFGTIDEPDKVLHEGYQHEFCDDELVGTAKWRGAWAFAEDSHVEHLHPDYGKAPWDDLYLAQSDRMRASRRLFARRRRIWNGGIVVA